MAEKRLPPFLEEEQREMIINMRKKGYSLQQTAKLFGVSKMVVYRLTGERVSNTIKDETKKDETKI